VAKLTRSAWEADEVLWGQIDFFHSSAKRENAILINYDDSGKYRIEGTVTGIKEKICACCHN